MSAEDLSGTPECKGCHGTGIRSGVHVKSGVTVNDFCPCKAKPCPFCGTAVNEKTRYQTSILTWGPLDHEDLTKGIHPENIEYTLACSGCGADGPLAHSQEEAVAAWNKRAERDESAELQGLALARRGFRIMARRMVAIGSGWPGLIASGRYERAGGDVLCTTCRQVYFEHPELPGFPTFHLICSGEIVKT